MTDTIQAISRQMSQDVRTLSTVSQNVANVNTTGYKSQKLVAGFSDALNPAVGGHVLDLRQGPMVQTGKSLDVALQGPGFFQVEQDGQTILSRSGALKIDADGRLRTIHGGLVMSDSGPITLSNEAITIKSNGEIWQAGTVVSRLSMVDIEDAAALQAVTGGYRYKGQMTEWQGSLVQGALEQSNVDVADETIRLMETTRHLESIQRAISTYDKVLEVGINRIGDN